MGSASYWFEIRLLHLLGINVWGHFLTPTVSVTSPVVTKLHEKHVTAPWGLKDKHITSVVSMSFRSVAVDILQCTESFLFLYGLSI